MGILRAGLIGFGTGGRLFHAPFIEADPRFSLDAVVSGDPARQQAVAQSYPAASVCATSAELFSRARDLDLVVISSPPATHVALAREAIGHGLAVVVDKPFAPSAGEAQALVEEAERAGVPLTVFHNRRWDGDFITLRRLLDEGALGEVRRFESRFEWWKPEETKAWKRESSPATGGGILYDLGTHLIDQAIQLFGPVRTSHAELAAHRQPGSDDDVFVSLLHETGVRSQLWMNGMAAQVGPRFHVLGSTSGYTKWGLDPQEASLAAGARPTDPGFGDQPEEAWGVLGRDGATQPVPGEPGEYAGFYAGLADALLDGADLPVDPRDAVTVIALIEDLHRRYGDAL